jgi:hypothetical protein
MSQISHALVLPDKDFPQWLDAVRPYLQKFERVAVVRSPAGNDLNRFRNVTAVQAPRLWMNDDALAHIRRIYPLVVRVDVIQASTPADLRTILQARANSNDRYGEQHNDPRHIFDRFVLDYPSAARPARILRGFSVGTDRNPDVHEGIDIYAPPGTEISAAADGRVETITMANDGLGYGAYIRIRSTFDNVSYVTYYGGMQSVAVRVGQQVNVGTVIGKAAGPSLKLVVQQPGGGMGGFRVPDVIDPTLLLYLPGLRVRSTVGGLWVRSLPSTGGIKLAKVTPADWLEVKEPHGRALAKLGVEDQWMRINHHTVPTGAYTAAWYLEAHSSYDPPEGISGVNIPGMNIDLDHPLGLPDASVLSKLGWVRLKYNVSLNTNFPEGDSRRYGNTDLNYTFNRYLPILERYARAGLKVILVLTHQTYGEGAGFVWHQMDTNRWREHASRFVPMVGQIAAQFRGRNLIYAYQLWNEQDTLPEHARAAVPMPINDYAHLLGQSTAAIRAADPTAKIITGGHVGGPGRGPQYARQTLSQLPAHLYPDGIAFHPYGRGPEGNRFSQFGTLQQSIRNWSAVMPGKPVWITEWGVLDLQHDPGAANQVSQYANGFKRIIEDQFPGQVACAVWYAWADGMDNGYGLVMQNRQPKQPLYSAFLEG